MSPGPALCHPQELKMGIYVPKIEMRSALNVSIFHFKKNISIFTKDECQDCNPDKVHPRGLAWTRAL